MEQLVESHALKLMSNDAWEFFSEGTCLVDKAGTVGALANDKSAGAINVRYARLLQELLAYKRGGLVQKILTLLLRLSTQEVTPTTAAKDGNFLLGACRVLAILTESRVVAQFCVTEEGAARKLGESLVRVLSSQDLFTACIPFSPSRNPGGDDNASNVLMGIFLYIALSCLRILANISRASRPFRRSLQQLDALFPSLEHLLSGDFVRYFQVREVSRLGKCILRVLNTFMAFEDTQEWALDHGFVRIHGVLLKYCLAEFEGGNILDTTDPRIQRLIFLNLSEDPGTESPKAMLEEQEKQAGSIEQNYFALDRTIRNLSNPQKTRELRAIVVERSKKMLLATKRQEQESLGISFPVHLVETLNASPTNPNYKKMQRSLAAWISGSSNVPAVCSWEHCGAGSELEAGRPFSKCSGCHLALYCR